MTRPTFEELMAEAGRFIGPPQPSKFWRRAPFDRLEESAQNDGPSSSRGKSRDGDPNGS